MNCRNCNTDKWEVHVKNKRARELIKIIQDPSAEHDLVDLMRMEVKLVCVKCGHQAKVWVMNAQLKLLAAQMTVLVDNQAETAAEVQMLTHAVQDLLLRETKPWWKFW